MSAPDSKPSLLEFVAAKKPGAACRVCGIPEVNEINAARQQGGVSYENIAAWLVVACGYKPGEISKHRVQRHFDEKHNG